MKLAEDKKAEEPKTDDLYKERVINDATCVKEVRRNLLVSSGMLFCLLWFGIEVTESSFLGFKLKNLNTNSITWILCIIVSYYFINLLLLFITELYNGRVELTGRTRKAITENKFGNWVGAGNSDDNLSEGEFDKSTLVTWFSKLIDDSRSNWQNDHVKEILENLNEIKHILSNLENIKIIGSEGVTEKIDVLISNTKAKGDDLDKTFNDFLKAHIEDPEWDRLKRFDDWYGQFKKLKYLRPLIIDYLLPLIFAVYTLGYYLYPIYGKQLLNYLSTLKTLPLL